MAEVFVASIGEVKYETIQAAVEASNVKDVIMLLENTTENVVIPEGKDIVFDLNGKTLSGGTDSNPENKDKPAILNNGTIVIKDSSNPSTGMIKRDDVEVGSESYYVLNNQGTMTIESGTVYNNSGFPDERKGGSSLICNADEPDAEKTYEQDYAKLYIKGGKLHQDNFIAIKNGSKGYVNMTGGEVVSANESAIQNWSNADISGGTVNGLIWAMAYDAAGDSNTKLSGDVTVNGKIWAENYSETGTKKSNITIDGGTYNLKVDEGKPGPEFRTNASCEISIKDGSFNVDPSEYLAEDAKISRGEDGKFTAAKKSGFMIAIKPRYATRKAVEKIIFPEEMFIDVLDEQVERKIVVLLDTCHVAIIKNGKFYPIDVDNMDEQFALANEGKELTVEEDPKFGIKKINSFVSKSLTDNARKLAHDVEIYNGIVYGKCDEVVDFEKLGIEAVNKNGYWLAFNFDLDAATNEGYSDLKVIGAESNIVAGDNFVFVNDINAIGIEGKLTVEDVVGPVSESFDIKLQLVKNTLDLDPRA